MNIKQFILLVFGAFVFFSAKAQPCTGTTIADADVSHLKILRVYYDNDLFAGTDRYYTQGIRAELILPNFKNLYLSKRILFRIGQRARTFYGLAVSHKSFTPSNITARDIVPDDHPYSGELFIGHFLISNDRGRKIRLTTEFDAGIIGPFTGAEFISGSQAGWDNQIKTDVLLRYLIKFEKGLFQRKGVDVVAFGKLDASTVTPHAALGAQFRIGRLNPYFYSLNFANRSIEGNREIKPFEFYFYGRGEGRVVGYDARLQGGLINRSSPYTLTSKEISRVIGEGAIGLDFMYKSILIGYEHVIQSPTFKESDTHMWGQIKVFFSW